jgi:hypothetical protein
MSWIHGLKLHHFIHFRNTHSRTFVKANGFCPDEAARAPGLTIFNRIRKRIFLNSIHICTLIGTEGGMNIDTNIKGNNEPI